MHTMALTPPPHPDDPMATTPESSGFFFNTLRQANTSAEHVANAPNDVRPSSSSIDTAIADPVADNPASNSTSMSEKDLEKGPDPIPQCPRAAAAAAAAAAAGASSTTPCAASTAACSSSKKRPVILPCGAMVPGGADDADSRDNHGWRRVVRNFTPSWFSVCMGTGVVSILLHNLPYNAEWVRYISIVVFCLNILLFIAFSAITLTRYIAYPEIWGVMIKHPSQSLFLGCIPMGFATIVKMMVFECARWGRGAIYLTWAFWWADVLVACACSLIIPFVIVHHHRNQLSHMTAALLLPVVPVVVSSASGSLLAEILPDRSHAVTTLVTSYILWGLGMAFSFFIMTVYFLRLQIHDLPPREVIVSVFLPIGPLGQGGFAIQQLGKVAFKLLPETGAFNGVVITGASSNESTLAAAAIYGGTVLYIMGILAGLFFWGAALGWLAFAIISIMTTKSFPFNMGWWGFVFPLGVLTSCTGMLATELDSSFFRVITMMFSACVFCLWILVAIKTATMVLHGDMFYAPCLRDLRPKEETAGGNRTV
ncbi:c4-dicarboxylate transporter malic acid transport [Ophiostoma piceae UAMH 11346]|uniref:Sulfite efflux pump SSU1 n=1 Tax=Ophiostoma piceae (strain UAMH 11346) TaxID=1262450 RepID=S3CD91_OPHP1|nr:c4-dicarboxylate transporter malic acid transport [Ophiostoma piceae UAMH 11346]